MIVARTGGSQPRRRGVALLAALWLVVAIATAGLSFVETARERRAIGLTAADRSRHDGALLGAVAHLQARIESELRSDAAIRPLAPSAARRPLERVNERFADGLVVGDVHIRVRAVDLGTVVNVNVATERELTVLLAALLRDENSAQRLAQAILDWRDADEFARSRGGEVAEYRRAGRVVVPANGTFRTLDQLGDVLGMTPTMLAALRPYLTTHGDARRVNLNAAPEPVLRTVPGMTPPLLAVILALRSGGRRVESVPALVTAVRGRGRGDAESGEYLALVRELSESVVLEPRELALELTVDESADQRAGHLTAVLTRVGDAQTAIEWRQW